MRSSQLHALQQQGGSLHTLTGLCNMSNSAAMVCACAQSLNATNEGVPQELPRQKLLVLSQLLLRKRP